MSFDTSMAALSLRLIAKRGKTITYTKVTQGAYSPATGAATTTETATTFRALVEEFSRVTDGLAFLSGLILDGDKHVIIAASSLAAPSLPGDKITVDGNIYTVQSVKVVYAGELQVLYDLRART